MSYLNFRKRKEIEEYSLDYCSSEEEPQQRMQRTYNERSEVQTQQAIVNSHGELEHQIQEEAREFKKKIMSRRGISPASMKLKRVERWMKHSFACLPGILNLEEVLRTISSNPEEVSSVRDVFGYLVDQANLIIDSKEVYEKYFNKKDEKLDKSSSQAPPSPLQTLATSPGKVIGVQTESLCDYIQKAEDKSEPLLCHVNGLNGQYKRAEEEQTIKDEESSVGSMAPKYSPFPSYSKKKYHIPILTSETIENLSNGRVNWCRFGNLTCPLLHPRQFQYHKLLNKWKKSLPLEHGYYYKINKHCPPSPNNEHLEHECNKVKRNCIFYRYSRQPKQNKESKEVLCRFCITKRWFPLGTYKLHLLYSHGIFTPAVLRKPQEVISERLDKIADKSLSEDQYIKFLPLPCHLYEHKICEFSNIYVQCPLCRFWVMLGNKIDDDDSELLDHFGLYEKYFFHAAACKLGHGQHKIEVATHCINENEASCFEQP